MMKDHINGNYGKNDNCDSSDDGTSTMIMIIAYQQKTPRIVTMTMDSEHNRINTTKIYELIWGWVGMRQDGSWDKVLWGFEGHSRLA